MRHCEGSPLIRPFNAAYVYMCACVCVCVLVCVRVCAHVRQIECVYTHTHTHTHTKMCQWCHSIFDIFFEGFKRAKKEWVLAL